MRVLRDITSINTVIHSCSDFQLASLLRFHVAYLSNGQADGFAESLTVVIAEPGDTLHAVDGQMDHQLLTNNYSGKRIGDAGFRPCFETLEEYPSFFEMLFIQSDDGSALVLLVPKLTGIDRDLLAMCARHSAQSDIAP